jgi:hypothetical protein
MHARQRVEVFNKSNMFPSYSEYTKISQLNCGCSHVLIEKSPKIIFLNEKN